MNRGRQIVMVVVACLVAVLLAAPKTEAATNSAGLQLSPLRSYPAQDPGTVTEGSLQLTNLSKETQHITLSAEIFSVTDQQYDYNFEPSSVTKWFSFSQNSIDLAVGKSQKITYNIAVPVGATPGGHYFALIASTTPSSSGSQLIEVRRVASLVYLQVNGAIREKSTLLSSSVPRITTRMSLPVFALLANTGNTHIRARLDVSARRQPFGSLFGLGLIDKLILPSTVRQVSGEVRLPSVPGLYKVTIQYAPAHGQPISNNHYVFYAPVWLWVILVGVAGLFTYISWSAVRRYKRRW